ncbi:MAG: DoxX family protein [Polyangiaceae bacterium]
MKAPGERGEGEKAAVPLRERARTVLRAVLALAMISVGVLHFASPAAFEKMIPRALPYPLALVYVSGLAEIAGGAGLLIPRFRRAASFGLIALYVAVFPANINMAVNDLPLGDAPVPTLALWARLPLQLVFIAWAYWAGRNAPDAAAPPRP